MKNINIQSLALFILCLSLFSFNSFSQELMFKVPLEIQVVKSSHIVEGKVISKNSFWDVNHKNIYTVNTIEVYKSFKGRSSSTIDIITEGGVVDMTAQITTLSLELAIGEMGVFMLNNSNVQLSQNNTININKYEAYSAMQGFYKYNLHDDLVTNPYHSFKGISQEFYSQIMTLTQSGFTQVNRFDIESHVASVSQNRIGGLVVTNFSPDIITGGTRSVLTINGAGFGATLGQVLFRDANAGGTSYFTALDSQIVNWSDTQIQVEVPSRAGTGTFRVVNSTGAFNNSTSPILVPYSEINVTNSNNVAYPTQHINDNGSGGYTWSMNAVFFLNADANPSFTRAFDTWRCETGINWDIDPNFTTVNTIALDNINIIRFDNNTELPDGILGRNTSYFNGCAGGTEWFISELDIVFNDSTNWQYGPASATGSQVDFETVAVHELGHAHQLAHVINNTAIMHYTISNGITNRNLSANDILGGNDVQSRSTTNPVCSRALMTNHGCSLGIDDNDLSSHFSVFPNPAKNEMFIKNGHHISIETVELFDMTGRLVKRANYKVPQALYSLNVNNLSVGVYLINISFEGKMITKKLIID